MKLPRPIRRLLLWGGGIIIFTLILWGMAKLSENVQLPAGSLSVPVSAQDNSEGPADAPLTLVEYSDFQCPACAVYQPLLTKLFADPDLTGKIRIVFRQFPLTSIHENAMLAAQAAQASALQRKFWEMHDLLFANQDVWKNQSDTEARATFALYAVQIGLDNIKYSTDLDRSSVKEFIQSQYASGISSGVNSTPSFFINGTRMAQPGSYEQLKQSVLSALK